MWRAFKGFKNVKIEKWILAIKLRYTLQHHKFFTFLQLCIKQSNIPFLQFCFPWWKYTSRSTDWSSTIIERTLWLGNHKANSFERKYCIVCRCTPHIKFNGKEKDMGRIWKGCVVALCHHFLWFRCAQTSCSVFGLSRKIYSRAGLYKQDPYTRASSRKLETITINTPTWLVSSLAAALSKIDGLLSGTYPELSSSSSGCPHS